MKKIINKILDLIYPMFGRFMTRSVFAYLSLGAANTALNILLFAWAYHFLFESESYEVSSFEIQSYTLSLLFAFILTVPSGYWLAKHFAFQSDVEQSSIASFFKYCLVVGQGLVSDYVIMKVLIVWLLAHPTIAKISSTVIVLTINYLLQKYFTFKAGTSEA